MFSAGVRAIVNILCALWIVVNEYQNNAALRLNLYVSGGQRGQCLLAHPSQGFSASFSIIFFCVCLPKPKRLKYHVTVTLVSLW